MPLIIALPASVIIALLMITLYASAMAALDELSAWWERHKKVKELRKEYAVWYDRYQSCDEFSGLEDKAKAEAVCIVLQHKIDVLRKRL